MTVQLPAFSTNEGTKGAISDLVLQVNRSLIGPPGPKIACLGDSLQDTAFEYGTASIRYRNYAMPTWIRYLTKQRVNLPFSMNFAVSGNTLDQIAVRVPACIAAQPDIIIFNGGTNNLTVSQTNNTYPLMKNVFLNQIAFPIYDSGIPMIICTIPPRPVSGIPGFLPTMMAFNHFLRELCFGGNLTKILEGYSHPFKSPAHFYIADPVQYMTNYADTNGDPLTGYLRDTVHPTAQGAYWMALPVANVLNQILPPQATQTSNPADYYSASLNIAGNLLRSGTTNQGLLAGTGGTLTTSSGFSFSTTSQIATGYSFARGNTGSTVVASLSKENPRTDGPNSGERQRIVLLGSNTSAQTDEQYSFRFINTLSITTSSDIRAGDWVYVECGLQVVSASSSILGIKLGIAVFGGTANGSVDMMIMIPDSQVYPQVSHSGVMRTEPVNVGNNTSLTTSVVIEANSTASNVSVDLFLADFYLRKVTS